MTLVRTKEDFQVWCEKNKYTKEELADALGVTRQTLYNWTRLTKLQAKELPAEVRHELVRDDRAMARIPIMLTLSLFALENLPAGEQTYGHKRK